jgi:hypothetical protein
MLEGVSNVNGPIGRQIVPWAGEGSHHRRYGQIHLLQRPCLAIDRLSGSPLRGELRKLVEIIIPHSSKLIAPRKRLLKIKMQPPKSSREKLGGWDTSRWILETSQDFKQHLNTHKTLQVKHLAFWYCFYLGISNRTSTIYPIFVKPLHEGTTFYFLLSL